MITYPLSVPHIHLNGVDNHTDLVQTSLTLKQTAPGIAVDTGPALKACRRMNG